MPRPTIAYHDKILVNGQEAADILGVHRATLEGWAKQGVIVREKPGVYDLKKITLPAIQHRLQQAGHENQTPQRSFNESRADLYKARAEREKLALGVQRGDLVEISAVTEALASALSVLRARLLGIGAKLAPRLSLITSVPKIKRMLDDEATLFLNEFANARIIETGGPDRGALGHGLDDEGGDGGDEAAADFDHLAVGGQASQAERRVER